MGSEALWRCPRCGRYFVNPGQWHSCGAYTVEDFLAGKGERAAALYERFAALVAACGPVLVAPARTRIGFQVRVIFTAVNCLSERGLSAHVILAGRLDSPRFRRIESAGSRSHVHHFRVASLDELDDEVAAWLCEAYQLGAQES